MDRARPERRSRRLDGYDYRLPGAYFITICTQDRSALFGHVENGAVRLTAGGLAIDCLWRDMPDRFATIRLDHWITMPDHLHAIVILSDPGDADGSATRRESLHDIVGAFKSISTNGWIRGVKEFGWPRFERLLWQRGFYEHVIRDSRALRQIRRYIRENPTVDRRMHRGRM